MLPHYLRQDIPHKALRSLSCLRLSGHEFQVQISVTIKESLMNKESVTDVLLIMSRINSMLFSTAHTPIQCLFAVDMSPYSQKQEHMLFFFFWWGLLHGPQQGPYRMKEKKLKDWEKENSCLNRKTLLEKLV